MIPNSFSSLSVPTVYLIDGSGFIFRAFHALPPLKSPEGTPVGAVYGFCNILLRFLEKLQHNKDLDFLGVIFDAGRKTFRQEIYPDYKAHRPEVPLELIPQFPLIREACHVLNVPSIEAVGFEADDLIASYTEVAKNKGYKVVIVSSDKDLMQLVDDQVTLLDPIKNRFIGKAEVKEKFGVFPDQVIDVQALMGDSSDNVPGVSGIGPKTAAELIHQFGCLDHLLEQAHTIKQTKRRESILQNIQLIHISKLLVTLKRTVPLPLNFDSLHPQDPDRQSCHEFFKKHGFKSLAYKFQCHDKPQIGFVSSSTQYEQIDTLEKLQEWLKLINKTDLLAVDTETTSLNIQQAKLVGISLAIDTGALSQESKIRSCYIPIGHHTDHPQLSLYDVTQGLKSVFQDPGILKIGHNLKYDLGILEKYDLGMTPISDTMLMSYCLDAGKHGHGLDELSQRHFHYKTISFEEIAGKGKDKKTFDFIPLEQATPYAAEDAEVALKLYKFLRKRLQEESKTQLYQEIERPLISVIVEMEKRGIRVDLNELSKLKEDFSKRLTFLEEEIYKLVGRSFNIGSPKQLGEILFEEWSLPPSKRTKTGSYITDADVLESLALQGHTLPEKVLEWRSLSKLKSTYIDGLAHAVNVNTQRIYTSFSMATTSTGRLTSSDPNLQNIPIRTEDGRKIRKAFIPEVGMKLVSLDYSQIELRLLAHKANVKPLVEAFQKGEDIHTATASQIFGLSIDHVSSLQRRQAKTINFGIIYGISSFGLGQQLGIPSSQASVIIKTYFEQYPGIRAYMEQSKDQARKTGYVETLFGRRCYIPGILDKNLMTRSAAERQAINAPLQGSNADIIKKAMVKIYQYLKVQKSAAQLLLQVHDELLFEIPFNETESLIPVLKKIMENITILSVPLSVEVGEGDNWDEAH